MTEQQVLPAGRKLCPGWTSEFSPESSVDQDGYAARYLAKKASGVDVKYACGSGRRTSDQAVIRDTQEMCSRCTRQKAKFDEENGARQRREQERHDRYVSLIEAYRQDVQVAVPTELAAVLAAVDGLVNRSEYPPHARRGEENYRSIFNDRDVKALDQMNVLRRLAGVEIKAPAR